MCVCVWGCYQGVLVVCVGVCVMGGGCFFFKCIVFGPWTSVQRFLRTYRKPGPCVQKPFGTDQWRGNRWGEGDRLKLENNPATWEDISDEFMTPTLAFPSLVCAAGSSTMYNLQGQSWDILNQLPLVNQIRSHIHKMLPVCSYLFMLWLSFIQVDCDTWAGFVVCFVIVLSLSLSLSLYSVSSCLLTTPAHHGSETELPDTAWLADWLADWLQSATSCWNVFLSPLVLTTTNTYYLALSLHCSLSLFLSLSLSLLQSPLSIFLSLSTQTLSPLRSISLLCHNWLPV